MWFSSMAESFRDQGINAVSKYCGRYDGIFETPRSKTDFRKLELNMGNDH
jgi:hypothetical protein